MDNTELRFTTSTLDGCLVIECVFPRQVDVSKLAPAMATYMALWDDERPTVQLNDLREVEQFDEASRAILLATLRKNQTRANFHGAAWWVGTNTLIVDRVASVLGEAGRVPDNIFESREDAVAYLSDRIRRKCGPGD